MVKSYYDPIKQKTREKLRDFIKKNLTYRKIKDLKVVCFPGAEKEGEEAIEVKEVYDPLGIPRENIVGLEYNPESAERLKKANLGIEIICQDALEFFKRTDKKFDIISLDYTGQRTWKEKDITRYIAGRDILERFSIFCTNHLIKREGKKMKERLLNQVSEILFQAQIAQTKIKPKQEMMEEINEYNLGYNKAMENINDINLDFIRESITLENICILTGGTIDLNPIETIYKKFLESNPPIEIIKQEELAEIKNIKISAGEIEAQKDYWENRCKSQFAERILSDQLVETKGWTKEEAVLLLRIQSMQYQKGKSIKHMERYTYNSNKNAKMLFDIIALKPLPYRLVQGAKEIVDITPNSDHIILNYKRQPKDGLERKRKKLFEEISKELDPHLKQHLYLGSSWIKPKRKEKITKKDVIELLQAGCKPVEINENFAGFTTMQLAALKAHYVTMKKVLKQ